MDLKDHLTGVLNRFRARSTFECAERFGIGPEMSLCRSHDGPLPLISFKIFFVNLFAIT